MSEANIYKKFKVFRVLILATLVLIFVAFIAIIMFSIEDIVYADGELVGIYDYELKSVVATTVSELCKNEGDTVAKGDPIVKFDPTDLYDKIEASKSVIAEMEAEITVKKSKLEVVKSDPLPTQYRHIITQLDECRQKFQKSDAKMPIYKKLFTDKVISRVEYEKIEIEYIENKSALEKASADYERVSKGLAEKIIQQNECELQLLEVKLSNKRKELKMLENHLDDYILKAPEAGVITDLPYMVGRYVKKGEYIAKVSITTKKKYITYVDERQVYKIHEGDPVKITSRQYNYLNFGYFAGKVIQVSELPVQKAGKYYYPVEVLVTEEPYNLKLGSGAEIMIRTGKERIIVCLLGLNR